jgi:hypothetical protein
VNRAAAVSSTASELDLSRKSRRRDLRGRLKLPATVALASSTCGNEPPLLGHWGHRDTSGGGPGGTGKLSPLPARLQTLRFEVMPDICWFLHPSVCSDYGLNLWSPDVFDHTPQYKPTYI